MGVGEETSPHTFFRTYLPSTIALTISTGRAVVVTSANDNSMYHHAKLNGMRIVVPVAWKQIKAFKKRQEVEPDPDGEDEDTDTDKEPDEDRNNDRSEEDY